MPMFTNEYYSEQQKQVIFKKVRPSKGRAMGWAEGYGQRDMASIKYTK